jgi:O-acetyl-ADP-ribose deacetylase (regulator of RNase III)
MRLADENGLKSIAFSCISTGVYGFPKDEAARIATRVLTEHLQQGYNVEIIVCCFSENDAKYYQQ